MPTSDWAPNVADVGSLLRARTKDTNGSEVGTFTAQTRPTDTEVTALINQASADVAMSIGSDIPPAVWTNARSVAALGTALRVELTYFPEQINTGRSPYAQFKQMYDDNLKTLVAAVTAAGGATNDGGAPLDPSFSFPMTGDPFIVGRRTAW